jgi:acyl carrier protein phosphodiesterase
MNFLAHAHLSFDIPEILVGNFLADYFPKRKLLLLPEEFHHGVHLHRVIDSYTDIHEITKRSKRRLYESQGKYAAVLVDIFFDYFLTKNWSKYSDKSLEVFCEDVYDKLDIARRRLDITLQAPIIRLLEHRWLIKYATYEGLGNAIERLSYRLNFESGFDRAMDDLIRLESDLNEDFLELYPFVIKRCQQEMEHLKLL